MVPNKVELCDGKDDTCDGKTDEGCTAERATVGFGNSLAVVSDGKHALKAWTGGSATVTTVTGDKHIARWGFYRWLQALAQ